MSALAGFLQAILDLLGQLLFAALDWFRSVITTVWDAVMRVLDQLLAWGLDVLFAVLRMLFDSFVMLLQFAAHLLPPVPEPPQFYTDTIGGYLSILNGIFPLDLVFSLAALWAVIYGAIFLYKAAKFIRGGG